MQTDKLTIGRAKDNDVVLPSTYLNASKYHSEIVLQLSNQYDIRDLDSKNGTYVNDVRVSTSSITPDDEVRFGSHVYSKDALWRAIKNKFLKDRTDFNLEFNHLLVDFKDFEKQKEKIFGKARIPLFIRLGLIGAIIIVLLIFPNVLPDPSLRYPLIISGGLLATIVASGFSRSQSQKSKEYDLLKNKYEHRLVCPKCSFPFLSRGGYHYWKEKRTCVSPKCDAVYV
jgi:FOG: FHA domain